VDTLEQRWAKLSTHTTVYGPADEEPRPAVLIFHGCGGLRPHLAWYAEAAAEAGFRVFVIDSYGARGWNRYVGMGLVCTGAIFHGWERAGDVAAAIWGLSRRADVDAGRLALAGWSHGGWGIMELMAAPLAEPGELGLADAAELDLSGVRSVYLSYPYIGVLARGRSRPWLRRPKTFAVIAERDHLTTVRNAERVYAAVRGCEVEVETWTAPGTHSFDEPMGFPPMRHDRALAHEATERFRRFLEATLVEEPAAKPKRRARKA
jgi:dienelactone hydrolase